MSAKSDAKLEEFLKEYELEDVWDYLESQDFERSCWRKSIAKQVLGKSLGTLLAETNRGRTILGQGKKQMSLSLDMKNDLISIILVEIFSTGITIKYSDFSLLLDEICCLLPGEEKCKDYYFISRDGKKHPSGKLYSKYKIEDQGSS
ncbi:uncharacterized protein [Drosophila suzukii]|uniref:Uncharacterized protein isoform X2 n=1 Tax=Drosophila suzukii TaxID=28584 RepID=A0ABM4U084_DROSZ|nr:uncharacterized protein LOC108016336 isoform X2 [Drosophila suzukii]